MMTSVCSTSEYRTIIHVDTRFDPKVILVKCSECKETVCLMPACVLSDVTMVGQVHPESVTEICIYSKKSTGIA